MSKTLAVERAKRRLARATRQLQEAQAAALAERQAAQGRPTPPSELLRLAIAKSGETRYKVAVGSGLDYSIVYRFVARERGLTTEAFDKLCVYLGLTLRKS